MIRSRKIAKALVSLNKSTGDGVSVARNFIDRSSKKKTLFQLRAIVKHLELYKKKSDKENTATIILAREGTEKIKENILSYIGESNIKTEFKKDPEIIGGFVVKFKNKVYDASLNNQIEKLKRSLLRE